STIESYFFTGLVVPRAFRSLDLDPLSAPGLAFEKPQGKPPNDAPVGRRTVAAHPALIFAETHVPRPREIVLEAPMAAHGRGELRGAESLAPDGVPALDAPPSLRVDTLRE